MDIPEQVTDYLAKTHQEGVSMGEEVRANARSALGHLKESIKNAGMIGNLAGGEYPDQAVTHFIAGTHDVLDTGISAGAAVVYGANPLKAVGLYEGMLVDKKPDAKKQ